MDWTDHGDVFPVAGAFWVSRYAWGARCRGAQRPLPALPAVDWTKIGVAVSSSPKGPFSDAQVTGAMQYGEAPNLHKVGGTYYFTYSTGRPGQIHYATGTSLLVTADRAERSRRGDQPRQRLVPGRVGRVDGASVVQHGCHGGDNQQWTVRRIDPTTMSLVNRRSGKCLDVPGGRAGG
ncbi:RICIN domain-containing protein [Saccharothrix sp. S26]|uniref:RICIN domain-containing protein n=1 Tax=Saccharothrix sp. S26 TaxID=2907215 RepID=UPI001F22597E|nr:RICIN domain-containing protein [Saccharothrix sp. S26]MCE6998745.1 RICIN domain-containing protein [Saccharothrix sp. S26]